MASTCSNPPAAWTISAASGTGWMAPVSLLANINETNAGGPVSSAAAKRALRLPDHPLNRPGFAHWPADYWSTLGTSGLLTALSAVGRTYLSAGAGKLAEATGWSWFFVISTLTAIPSLLLLVWLIPKVWRGIKAIFGVLRGPPRGQPT